MNPKTSTIIFGMILLVGIVAAGNTLNNLEGITVPLNPTIAGNTFQANFSFDYLANGVNEDNSPLIIKLNITSQNQINYPVWKNDFQINGIVKKCIWTILGACIFPRDVIFSCSEIAPLTIVNPIDTTAINEISNGTFYCYNAEGDLKLNEHDEVFLNITSHPALYPGEYKLTAEMFYLNDTTAPFVNITNKYDFDRYYRELNNIEVKANITDGRGISEEWGTIFTPTQNITVPFSHKIEGVYYFTKILPNDIQEGNYELRTTATDTSGNIGHDNTTLKIDRTPPIITLIQPNVSKVYSDILPIEANVTDEKAGVNNQSVYYRLREIINGTICPEIGVPVGNYSCTRTDWLNLPYNGTTKTFKIAVNTTELNLTSGEYWLDIKAEDILGNERFLE